MQGAEAGRGSRRAVAVSGVGGRAGAAAASLAAVRTLYNALLGRVRAVRVPRTTAELKATAADCSELCAGASSRSKRREAPLGASRRLPLHSRRQCRMKSRGTSRQRRRGRIKCGRTREQASPELVANRRHWLRSCKSTKTRCVLRRRRQPRRRRRRLPPGRKPKRWQNANASPLARLQLARALKQTWRGRGSRRRWRKRLSSRWLKGGAGHLGGAAKQQLPQLRCWHHLRVSWWQNQDL